ncbi:hypothetical protein CDL12_00887 [Handroanthus impetiginosus]|uniref:BTB domain-containing protein n=1 Tax=Handroanthus impetiginosus TaxID=429701 RepID=A0A2G9I9E3_9LAMI|nr:hypothetical protein CDL12_00887 [Handroanthus impetiginosus]
MAREAAESASVTLRGSHEFLVNNYSLCKGIGVGMVLESEIFMVGGYQWTICFYPDGGDEIAYTKGYTSLCVCLKSKIISPLEFFWEVSLLDQSGRGNHVVFTYSREHNRRDPRAINGGSLSGYPEFIERASIEPSDNLKDDCLKISCTIEILAPHIQELYLQNVGSDFFSRLLEGKEGADVFFRVRGERFCAHKSLLAVCFPAFWSLFSCTSQHKEIVIRDRNPGYSRLCCSSFIQELLQKKRMELLVMNIHFWWICFEPLINLS